MRLYTFTFTYLVLFLASTIVLGEKCTIKSCGESIGMESGIENGEPEEKQSILDTDYFTLVDPIEQPTKIIQEEQVLKNTTVRMSKDRKKEPKTFKMYYVTGFITKIESVYGPAKPSSYIPLPKKILKDFKGAKTVMNLVSAFTSHFQDLEIPTDEYNWYNMNVKNVGGNGESWMNHRYVLMDTTQLRMELPKMLKEVIDQNMPESTLRMFIRRVERCKHGGTFVRFKRDPVYTTHPLRVSQSLKIFAAACSNPKKVQVLVFNALKTGYYLSKDLTPRIKKRVKTLLKKWLYALFFSRFSGPSNDA